MHCGETVMSEAIEDAVKASKGLLGEIDDGKRQGGEPHAHEHPDSSRPA